MNEIKNHSHPKFFVVLNPSEAVTAEAKRLAAANVNNAKVTPQGIIFHIDYKRNVETIAKREAVAATVVPEFSDPVQMENWLYDNIGGNVARYLSQFTTKQFNAHCAHKTVEQLKSDYVEFLR